MKKEIELDLIAKEVIDLLAKKDLSVMEAKLILERCNETIDLVTKLKGIIIRRE